MKRKESEIEIKKIIRESKFEIETNKMYDEQHVIKNTVFGNIYLRVDLDFKRKSHAIFMRFENWNDYQQKTFEDIYGGFNTPSRISGKWNFHTDEVESLICELKERISNLEYLSFLD